MRLKDWIACMALPVLPPDLEVPPPDNSHCSCNACYHPLQHQGGRSYEGHPVFDSQSDEAEYCLFYRALLQKSPIKETTFCQRDSAQPGCAAEHMYGTHIYMYIKSPGFARKSVMSHV